MRTEIISSSPRQTKAIGQIFARSLRGGAIVCLQGDLGGGKTTFAQGLAQGLGVRAQITSPSFVLMKRYDVRTPKTRIKHFYHLDCYRLKRASEIEGIGLPEILAEEDALILIEWAERISEYLPFQRITIRFKFLDQNQRKITFKTKL